MRTKWLVFLVAALAALALWGCGSNGGSGGSDVSDPNDPGSVDTVGLTNCTTCHENYTETQDWLASTSHGNSNSRPPSDYYGNDAAECAPCHDELGDGAKVSEAFRNTVETNRPVVSCESCHGGGSAHRGVGPMPYPRSGWAVCGPCHDDKHGLTVGTDFTEENPHLNSLNEFVFADDAETLVRARCSKCHSDEGARMHRLVSGDHDQLVAAFDGVADLADATAVECRTCHTPHAEETPLLDTDEVFTGSTEYNTCTNCHQLTYSTTDGGAWMKDAYHAPPVNQFGDYGEIISDTHYDDPATEDIEGYVVKNMDDGACHDCHNLHENDNTINNQWARSGHAGKISQAKEAAEEAGTDVFMATATPNGGNGRTGSCETCHTATGIATFLDSGFAGDLTYLQGSQTELLYCWGCHDDAGSGNLRNPGAITLGYTYDGTSVVLPDLGNTNVCSFCHGGRGNVDSMLASRSSRFAGHHAPSAGVLFSELTHLGYEYDLDGNGNRAEHYMNPSYFAHDGIGLNGDAPETGSGPCATCHMTDDAGHTFNVVTKDDAGMVTEIITQSLCDTCHTTYPVSPAVLNEESAGYQDAGALLNAYVDNTITNYQDMIIDETAGPDNDYGAFQNAKFTDEEPGAYAHNRFYVKRLLFDAINWLDDGILGPTITVDATDYPDAAHWFGADEITGEASRP